MRIAMLSAALAATVSTAVPAAAQTPRRPTANIARTCATRSAITGAMSAMPIPAATSARRGAISPRTCAMRGRIGATTLRDYRTRIATTTTTACEPASAPITPTTIIATAAIISRAG